MPNENQPNTNDREKPRRGVIYLCAPRPNRPHLPGHELSIDQQGVLCRAAAKALQTEIVGEFIDTRLDLEERPGLHQAMETIRAQRLDFLIVWSLDRLADDDQQLVKVAWHLGRVGTVPVPAEIAYRTVPLTSPE